MERTKKPTKESFTAPANSLTTKTPYKGLGADSEEKHEPVSDIDTVVADSLKVLDLKRPIEKKHEPVSDIDTVVADSLKVLDLKRPIREADLTRTSEIGRS